MLQNQKCISKTHKTISKIDLSCNQFDNTLEQLAYEEMKKCQ